MSQSAKTIDQLLAEAEPVIKFLSFNVRFPSQSVDRDDIAQYLRVEAWKLAKSYDQDRKQWKYHIRRTLKFRLIDAIRTYGCLGRDGELKRRQIQVVPFTEMSHEQDDGLAFDPVDHVSSSETETEFLEMESTVSNETTAARALFLRFRGFTMLEIAQQFDVSESRISQMLNESSTSYAIAIGRVRCLAGER